MNKKQLIIELAMPDCICPGFDLHHCKGHSNGGRGSFPHYVGRCSFDLCSLPVL